MKKIVYTLLLLFLLFTSLYALEKEKAVSIYKEKLVIADFANNSSWQDLDRGLTDDLTALFTKTKRFDIIERGQLSALLKEQELQLSGIVNTADAVKLGQMVGANYMIFGSITSADGSHTEKEVIKRFKDKETGQAIYREYLVTTWVGRVTISARLVEVNTGRVIIGKTVSADAFEQQEREKNDKSFLESILGALTSRNDQEAITAYHKQMHQKVVNSARQKAAYSLIMDFLNEFPLSGYVLDRTENDDYLIDLGTEKGMNSKVNLKVLGETEKIKHPVTGEIINVRTKSLGYLQVIDLGVSTSIAKVVKGDSEMITPGIKLEVVEPIFIWHRALASFLVPGLGQILEKRWGSGILFFLGEGLLIFGAYESHRRSTDEYIKKEKGLLDTTDWSKSDADRQAGEQYQNARTQALTAMWIFIGLEAIIHIWDTIDAGYPAEKNDVFVRQRPNDDFRFSFENIKNENKFYLSRSFEF